MGTEGDRREFRDAIKLTREIFAQKAFDPFRGAELSPGPGVRSDDQIDAHIRRKAESAYHPSCTCKMGAADDPLAVVDGQLRVRGVAALRVVDASVMPAVVSGNLNAPTIMIAEKAADLILGKTPLPPTPVPVFVPADWQARQR
jgi:choline dehydrogenase